MPVNSSDAISPCVRERIEIKAIKAEHVRSNGSRGDGAYPMMTRFGDEDFNAADRRGSSGRCCEAAQSPLDRPPSRATRAVKARMSPAERRAKVERVATLATVELDAAARLANTADVESRAGSASSLAMSRPASSHTTRPRMLHKTRLLTGGRPEQSRK